MAEFLTTRLISAELEQLINEAKAWIFLISPYNDIPETLFQCIKSADNKGKKIYFVYGKKKELNQDTEAKLRQLRNLDLFFCDNLHAKCYFNESTMIITSMNLYAYSDQNNREMGVLAKKIEDSQIYEKAYQEVQRVMEHSARVSLAQPILTKPQHVYEAQPKRVNETQPIRGKQSGYCIRCGTPIDFNADKPHCYKCFQSWNRYGDIDYPEKYCHQCGKKTETTKDQPRCSKCNPDSFSNFMKGLFG